MSKSTASRTSNGLSTQSRFASRLEVERRDSTGAYANPSIERTAHGKPWAAARAERSAARAFLIFCGIFDDRARSPLDSFDFHPVRLPCGRLGLGVGTHRSNVLPEGRTNKGKRRHRFPGNRPRCSTEPQLRLTSRTASWKHCMGGPACPIWRRKVGVAWATYGISLTSAIEQCLMNELRLVPYELEPCVHSPHRPVRPSGCSPKSPRPGFATASSKS